MIIGRKGEIEPWARTLIILLLAALFAAIAIYFLSDSLQQVAEAFNAKVLGKAGIESVKLPGQLSAKFTPAQDLVAKITIVPEPPACRDETLQLSAKDSVLPKDIAFSNIVCRWDLNTAQDTDCAQANVRGCGDGVVDNDEDRSGCDVATDSVTVVSETKIKLAMRITGNVKGSGTERSAEKSIVTKLFCEKTQLAGTIIKNNDIIPIVLPQKANVLGAHIGVYSGQQEAKLLILDVGDDSVADYSLSEGKKFTGNFMVEGQNLAQRVNALLATCENPTCSINVRWKMDTNVNLQITDVNMPYELRQF